MPNHRGKGIGEALLDLVDKEFERLGVADVLVGLLPSNEGARRLYERRGFRPTWLPLSIRGALTARRRSDGYLLWRRKCRWKGEA